LQTIFSMKPEPMNHAVAAGHGSRTASEAVGSGPAGRLPTPQPSASHLVLIPSYNPGAKVFETVSAARRYWAPVWVVVDGSTDGTGPALTALAQRDPDLRVISLPNNCGKGAAVLHGVREALRAGFTHVLTMDSDGQHPADQIPSFMSASSAAPDAMILGDPVFDASAPLLRVRGRRISNWMTNLETLWVGIHDSLFGFRVYPAAPLERVMRGRRWMRRFDFDAEVAVRLCWRGVRPVNLPAPVRYFRADEGGVSHFRYLRDNVLLTWMHVRLFAGFLIRAPVLVGRRLRRR
jgi:glycosyltransferase involved in cell wall biosynthesis